jgi:hypothetical protein
MTWVGGGRFGTVWRMSVVTGWEKLGNTKIALRGRRQEIILGVLLTVSQVTKRLLFSLQNIQSWYVNKSKECWKAGLDMIRAN